MRTLAPATKSLTRKEAGKAAVPMRSNPEGNHVARLLVSLQHSLGNQAVQRLLGSLAQESPAACSAAVAGSTSPSLGLHGSVPGKIQTKLTVNAPGDLYEQEAERAADAVMRMPDPQSQQGSACGAACPTSQARQSVAKHKVQTKSSAVDLAGSAEAPPIVDSVLRSPGVPIDAATRAFFEPRFQHDFSHVRVHADAQAAHSARAVNALAYTVGHNIVFGPGQYQDTATGRRLLAHELTHVVQQAGDHGVANTHESGMLQRDIPPPMAPATPAMQKPYYHTEEAIADLRRAVEMVKKVPPDFDMAKIIIKSVYDWLDRFVTGGRAQVVAQRGADALGVFDTCRDARNAAGEMYGKLAQEEFDMRLRGRARPSPDLLDHELQRVEFARKYLLEMEESVSYEVKEARNLPDVATRFANLTRSQMHVLAWLEQHRSEIAASAAQYRVDRRAVAGAIAFEATEQVKTSSLRALGPGKPHKWEFLKSRSAVEETEALGYISPVPKNSAERDQRLTSPKSEYVAGIMGVCADISERFGLSIRNDPAVLATVYQGWTPLEWGAHLKERAPALTGKTWPRPVVANPMGVWVEQHLPYLEEAVGFTRAEQKALGEVPRLATPAGTTLNL